MAIAIWMFKTSAPSLPALLLCLTLCLLGGVLKGLKSQFMKDVLAEEIAKDAESEGIITRTVKGYILGPKHTKSANEYLYEHLYSQAKIETMRKLCQIMEDAEGCDKMNDFSKVLNNNLDEVSIWGK